MGPMGTIKHDVMFAWIKFLSDPFTLHPAGRVVLWWVCLCVCPCVRGYLTNHWSGLFQIRYTSIMVVIWPFSDNDALCYVCVVLCMTSFSYNVLWLLDATTTTSLQCYARDNTPPVWYRLHHFLHGGRCQDWMTPSDKNCWEQSLICTISFLCSRWFLMFWSW